MIFTVLPKKLVNVKKIIKQRNVGRWRKKLVQVKKCQKIIKQRNVGKWSTKLAHVKKKGNNVGECKNVYIKIFVSVKCWCISRASLSKCWMLYINLIWILKISCKVQVKKNMEWICSCADIFSYVACFNGSITETAGRRECVYNFLLRQRTRICMICFQNSIIQRKWAISWP
jgi:hypothetical protein